jgi:predicted chitinase
MGKTENKSISQIAKNVVKTVLPGLKPVVQSFKAGDTEKERERLLTEMAEAAGITGVELLQFLAQASHESAGFSKYTEEHILDVSKIEGGEQFRGRGAFHLTHDYNYLQFGKDMGKGDYYVRNPDELDDPVLAAQSAIWFWNKNVKPRITDFNDTKSVTRIINGGYNGLSDRTARFNQYVAKSQFKDKGYIPPETGRMIKERPKGELVDGKWVEEFTSPDPDYLIKAARQQTDILGKYTGVDSTDLDEMVDNGLPEFPPSTEGYPSYLEGRTDGIHGKLMPGQEPSKDYLGQRLVPETTEGYPEHLAADNTFDQSVDNVLDTSEDKLVNAFGEVITGSHAELLRKKALERADLEQTKASYEDSIIDQAEAAIVDGKPVMVETQSEIDLNNPSDIIKYLQYDPKEAALNSWTKPLWERGLKQEDLQEITRLDNNAKLKARQDTTALDALGAMVSNTWISGIYRAEAKEKDWSPDDNFEMTPDFTKEIVEGLPQEYSNSLIIEAESEGHARVLRRRYLLQIHNAKQMMAHGVPMGVALNLLGYMSDPAVLLSLMSAGVLGTAAIPLKLIQGSRVLHMLRGSLITGVGIGVPEYYLNRQRGDLTPADYTHVLLLATGIGGAFGYRGAGKFKKMMAAETTVRHRRLQKVNNKRAETYIKKIFKTGKKEVDKTLIKEILPIPQIAKNIGDTPVDLRFTDGGAYRGQIKNNKPHGRGMVITDKGHAVEAEFKNGKVILNTTPEQRFYKLVMDRETGKLRMIKKTELGQNPSRFKYWERIIQKAFTKASDDVTKNQAAKDGYAIVNPSTVKARQASTISRKLDAARRNFLILKAQIADLKKAIRANPERYIEKGIPPKYIEEGMVKALTKRLTSHHAKLKKLQSEIKNLEAKETPIDPVDTIKANDGTTGRLGENGMRDNEYRDMASWDDIINPITGEVRATKTSTNKKGEEIFELKTYDNNGKIKLIHLVMGKVTNKITGIKNYIIKLCKKGTM